MKTFIRAAIAIAASTLAVGYASAAVTTIANSALNDSAQLYSSNFGDLVLSTGGGNAANVGDPTGRNDDGFGGAYELGYTLQNFFGGNYSQFYINTNGNITFNDGLPAFTPQGPQGAVEPVIAPFFADVDTRGALSGTVYVNQSTPGQTIVTWDHVGYFGTHDDKLNTFQLVLRSSDYAIPAGEGQIGFFWGSMNWETGDASGGTDGFGGSPAAVGFGDGQQNGYVLEASLQDGVSRVVDHKSIWFNLGDNGIPAPVPGVPEPETYALMLAGLGLLSVKARRRRS